MIPAIAIFLLAGCFQVSTVVRVNPDGSGTVVETMLLSKKMISQMNEMMQGFAGENAAKPKPIELFEPAKLKAESVKMGAGGSYMSGEKSATVEYTGYTATYAFMDINKLKLNQKSDESAGGPLLKWKRIGRDGAFWPPVPPADSSLFWFSKGPPATLTVDQPKDTTPVKAAEVPEKDAESPQAGKGVMTDEEAKQLVEMFMGMKMVLAIEVNGSIVETNATHRDGSRITIVDLDLAKFGSSLPQMEKLKRLQGSSLADAKEMMKDFPGMKVDLNDRLNVLFSK